MPSSIDDSTPSNGVPLGDPTAHTDRDDTTRYLCAAAHMDADYANAAIKEFLVEPTRPVTPSPGVDAGLVLTEAIAARTRRKLVDSGLLLLAVAFLIAAPTTLTVVWIILAVIVAIPVAVRRASRKTLGAQKNPMPLILIAGTLVVLVPLFADDIAEALEDLFEGTSRGYSSYYAEEEASSAPEILAIVFIVLMFAILLTDRFSVWRMLTTRFHRGAGNRRLPPPELESRQIFQFSPNRFLTQLRERYLNPRAHSAPEQDPGTGAPARIIVHRGFYPFVGGGARHQPWSIAIPLVKSADAEETTPLSTAALYDGIVGEATKLQSATSLTPGGRLRSLSLDELIVVSSAELIDHLGDPASTWFLPSMSVAPYDLLSPKRTAQVRDQPVEWARYYRCFRVETWDRDLVLSVYLHVAMDDTMLYVEWTPSVLAPIQERFQDIDTEPRSVWRPIAQGITDLLTLPVTIPRRLSHTFTFLRPLRDDRGVINSDKYGALRSLRELAADVNMHNYFQLADRDRYLKILESRVVLAVSRLLTDAGYTAAGFEAQAAAIIQNNVHIGGSVTGNVVAGTGNIVGGTSPATPKQS